MNIQRIQPLIVLVALALLANAAMAADTIKKIVSPADFENKEGEGESGVFYGSVGNDPRFQQFYLASDFSSALPDGGYIKEIRFRTDGQVGATAAVIAHIEVSMSYTPGFGFISTTFDQNKGAQYAQVYSGPLQIPESQSGNYDVAITLQNPFYYNPQAGNLMLDYIQFDRAHFAAGLMDRTGLSLHTRTVLGTRFDSSGSRGDGGLITQFTVDAVPAVPEPGIFALMSMSAAFFAVCRRRTEK